MAIGIWKRFEQTPQWQRKKRFLKRLTGRELDVRVDIDVPVVKQGGWWFSADHLHEDSIVYSLGVGDEINFDLWLIEHLGLHVYAFDPTPNSMTMLDESTLPEHFHFKPWAVTLNDGTLNFYPRLRKDGTKDTVMFTMIACPETVDDAIDVPAYSLPTITTLLEHDTIDLLKMDIEGAEFEVLDGMLDSAIRPRQLLVEFHHRYVEGGLRKAYAVIGRLRDNGYRLIAVSEIGRELTFLRQ